MCQSAVCKILIVLLFSLSSIKILDRRTLAVRKLDVWLLADSWLKEMMEQAQHWVHEIVIDDQLLVERQRAPVPLCVTAEELPGRDNLFQCASSSVLPCEELHFQWLFPGSPKP